jgi:hypothetical protein
MNEVMPHELVVRWPPELDRLGAALQLYPSALRAPLALKLTYRRALNRRRALIVRTIMMQSGADGFALAGRLTQRKAVVALRAISAQGKPFSGNPWDDHAVTAYLIQHLAPTA